MSTLCVNAWALMVAFLNAMHTVHKRAASTDVQSWLTPDCFSCPAFVQCLSGKTERGALAGSRQSAWCFEACLTSVTPLSDSIHPVGEWYCLMYPRCWLDSVKHSAG